MSYLLKPVKVGHLQLSNRLVMPPMATAKADDEGIVSQALLDYYDEKTKGGYISLVIIEHSYVRKDGKGQPRQLFSGSDEVLDGLMKLAEVVHENGSKVMMQLNHVGSAGKEENTGSQLIAPSAVLHPKGTQMPKELSREEIKEIIKAYRDAAIRTKKAGFDGAELHSSHGYLLNQFYSPLTNKRTDEYGGSVMNRVRIHLEIINEIRSAVGKDFVIAVRLGASDYLEGGTVKEDSKIAAAEFEKAGVDLLDISGGLLGPTAPGVNDQGFFSPLTEEIKKVVSIPVILTGGITDPEVAERLLAEGKADLIGVGRALLKDSSWAKRAVESLK